MHRAAHRSWDLAVTGVPWGTILLLDGTHRLPVVPWRLRAWCWHKMATRRQGSATRRWCFMMERVALYNTVWSLSEAIYLSVLVKYVAPFVSMKLTLPVVFCSMHYGNSAILCVVASCIQSHSISFRIKGTLFMNAANVETKDGVHLKNDRSLIYTSHRSIPNTKEDF